MKQTIIQLHEYFAEIANNEATKYFRQEAKKIKLEKAIPELLNVLTDLRPLRDNDQKTEEYLNKWLNTKIERVEVLKHLTTGEPVYAWKEDADIDFGCHDMFVNWLFGYFRYLYENKTGATIGYAYALFHLTQWHNLQILNKRIFEQACELPNCDNDDVCAAIEAEAPIASNDWDFYYNTKNIENQQLVFETIEYLENVAKKDTANQLDFLNLLWAQRNFVQRNISRPQTIINTLKGLPLDEEELHRLLCFLIKWMGGYPIDNMGTQYKTTYSLIVKEFLAYPKDTPEKEFCKSKWYVNSSKRYGDLIHSEEYERAQIEVLEKEVAILKSQLEDLQCKLTETKVGQDNTEVYPTSSIRLSNKKGMKINYIRVINCLYELGFFTDAKGNDITKKEVFAIFGTAVEKDLSDYDKDLSRSLSDNTTLDKHLEIFNLMENKMTEIFNSK